MRTMLTAMLSLLPLAGANAESIRVAAAISLKEAITQVARAYQSQTGEKVEFIFGSSGQLLSQIKSGAPIDLFISAANKQVDDLIKAGLADPATRRVLAGNVLVLIVPADSKLEIKRFEDLARAEVKRIAVGEPKTVPAGQYAEQVFKNLKLTDILKNKLVYGANVRQVLDYVERGEVSAGVVYRTDALQSREKVRLVTAAPAESHEPIVYPAVVVKTSPNRTPAVKFLDFVLSDKAQEILKAAGFTPPPKPPASRPATQRSTPIGSP